MDQLVGSLSGRDRWDDGLASNLRYSRSSLFWDFTNCWASIRWCFTSRLISRTSIHSSNSVISNYDFCIKSRKRSVLDAGLMSTSSLIWNIVLLEWNPANLFFTARIGSVVGVRNGERVGEATSSITFDSSNSLLPLSYFFLGLVLVTHLQTGHGILNPLMNSWRSWYLPLLITSPQRIDGSIWLAQLTM